MVNKSSPIIEIATALDLIKDERTIILDATIDKVNQKIDNENKELIPNSVFFDIEGKFSDHQINLPHTMVDPITFQNEARQIGINEDSIIIIYDRWGVYSSPRAWWMLTYMGHKNVYVLNGGLPIWKQNALPTTKVYRTPEKKGDFTSSVQHGWAIDSTQILSALDEDTVRIIDARSKGRFDGTASEPRPGLRSGHIPGSTNIPFDQVLDDTRYQNDLILKSIFSAHIDHQKQHVFSCGSGISASILALAAQHLGIANIAVYDGSWSEWGANPKCPIATSASN